MKKAELKFKSMPTGFKKMPVGKVADFSQAINKAMREVNRDFQRNQKISMDNASKIVLNA